MRRWQRRGERGFTLVEMLVCMAVLVLLMAVFAPALTTGRAKTRLAAAAHELALALSATRDRALVQREPEIFAIDIAKGVYRGGDAAPHHLDRDIEIQLVAAHADARGGAIRFFADGESSGGVVRLTLDERQVNVLVDWLTGRISIATSGG